jgi:hypothetical protein
MRITRTAQIVLGGLAACLSAFGEQRIPVPAGAEVVVHPEGGEAEAGAPPIR